MSEQPPSYPPPPGGYGYPGPQPGGYPPPGLGYPPQSAGTNGMAIAALVSSLLGWVCAIGPILGVIFGFVALSQIKKTGQSGRGMALAGIIIGFVVIAIMVVYLVLVVVFAATHPDTNAAGVLLAVGQQTFAR